MYPLNLLSGRTEYSIDERPRYHIVALYSKDRPRNPYLARVEIFFDFYNIWGDVRGIDGSLPQTNFLRSWRTNATSLTIEPDKLTSLCSVLAELQTCVKGA